MKKWLVVGVIGVCVVAICFIVQMFCQNNSWLTRSTDFSQPLDVSNLGQATEEKNDDWLTISTDVSKSLVVSTLDETTAEQIINKAEQSMYYGTFSRTYIDELYKIAPFRELRYACTTDDMDYYYTIYQTKDGYLFVFLNKDKTAPVEELYLNYVFFGHRVFDFSDFQTIEIGSSTKEQVYSIDSLCDKLPTRCFVAQTVPSWDSCTVHVTKTGVVVLGYKKLQEDYVVCYKEHLQQAPFQNLCPADLSLLEQ